MKTGSPTLGFQHPAANIPQIQPPQPPLQRTAMQRHQARKSGNFLPKLAPGQANNDMVFQGSPQGHPTPSSHASSPTSISTRSPMVIQQGGNSTPPTSAILAQPQMQQYHNFAPRSSQQPPNQAFQQRQQMSPNAQRPVPPSQFPNSHAAPNRNSLTAPMSVGGNVNPAIPASQFYPSPFQKHIDQLGKFSPIPIYRTVFVLD